MSKVSEGKLERHLALYTLAAAATVAIGRPAQAEIIFTPSNLQFTGSTIYIDIDNDGAADFMLKAVITGGCSTSAFSCSSHWDFIPAAGAPPRNGVAVNPGTGYEAALKRGDHIGRPNDRFTGQKMVEQTQSAAFGSWWNVTDRYLGVKLVFNGLAHYGWVGFSQTRGYFQAKLSGWAYETKANTPIRAGQRTGTADSPMAEDSENATSLQLRAAGHVAQPVLRNRTPN